MIFRKFFLLFIFFQFQLFTIADINIEIKSGINSAYPIAVIPFVIDHQYNVPNNDIEDIASVISADLKNTGKFNILPVSYLPHQPSKLSDIIPIFWKKLGINMIILGSIKVNHHNNYVVSYQLIDTSGNPALIILENQYSIKEQLMRHISHVISNEIFKKLTGTLGIFCTRIAYVSYNKHIRYPYELCIADYDGYNKVSIYKSLEPLMSPAWSPDGKKIAYVTFVSGHAELVIRNLETGLIDNTIKFPNHNGAPSFSPDGTKLAFSSSQTGSLNLYIMDLCSKKIHQLTENRYNNTEPVWFPDSMNLAYTSDQGGIPQVYKININNSDNSQRLSWLPGSNQKPTISADGTYIIMVNRYQGNQKIAKLNLSTVQEEILTIDTVLADTPSISPNGMMIIYCSILKQSPLLLRDNANNNSNHFILELISYDGKFKTNLKGFSGNIKFPTWSPFLS